MRHSAVLTVLAATVCGCVSGGSPFPPGKALVDDVAVAAPNDSGYRVAEVDGKPAQRAGSRFMTVVPFVLVEPGEHTLRLDPKRDESLPPAKVTATFEAGKRYRLQREGDVLSVVEEPK